MRLIAILTAAAFSDAGGAHRAARPRRRCRPSQATDISAAKKKEALAKKPKEEYLKAAPGAGPSGPKK